MSSGTNETATLDALREYIRNDRGFDFTGYKRASLERRITKRMRAVRVETYQEYLDYLQVQVRRGGAPPEPPLGLSSTYLGGDR